MSTAWLEIFSSDPSEWTGYHGNSWKRSPEDFLNRNHVRISHQLCKVDLILRVMKLHDFPVLSLETIMMITNIYNISSTREIRHGNFPSHQKRDENLGFSDHGPQLQPSLAPFVAAFGARSGPFGGCGADT